ncbi:hypothetical protein QP119_02295 [Corynebacterium frankenforstense]|uniref:hypothetical protein n=1 Tax=Corynebacterium TaxID=1716 RepID=UPI00254F59E4|nr:MULTISPECIES: hypothetical protein [Corynebacterium]MDK6259263.1 hypothetical protein [Corynebacterium frankenforstense]MDK8894485.1 hypothetical protein [Corynebacterium sp. MSK006]
MDWSLVISALSLSFAPITLWLGWLELNHQLRRERATQLKLEFGRTGNTANIGDGPTYNSYSVSVRNSGLQSYQQLKCRMVGPQGAYASIGSPTNLASGEELEPTRVWLTDEEAETVYLHVSWTVPRQYQPGIDYRAVRVHAQGQVEIWRPYRFRALRRWMKKDIGGWRGFKSHPIPIELAPGWPRGKPTTHLDWGSRPSRPEPLDLRSHPTVDHQRGTATT